MYAIVLACHSVWRWVVILTGAWAVLAAARASGRNDRTPADARPGLVFTMTLDVQLVFGLLLYLALSPITQALLANIGAAMSDTTARYWVAEHPVAMVLAVVFAHVGRAGARGKATPPGRRALVWYALSLVLILLATPWPFLPQGRPWLRL
jgi:hypothetical protein